ncbi:MAG: DNA-binding transcriptional repressor MarR [Thermoleophilia bacterium]|nr:DNA-binding transcriptional repressor MarR [Thermoleophilia bacterium]
MEHASTPSASSCAELLRALPALTALKRNLRHVTPPDAGWLPTLGALCRAPDGLRLTHLADILFVDASVTSRHVAQLEALGFAERQTDPADRRASLLAPTDAGRAWMGDAVERFATHVSSALPGWEDEDVDLLTTLLQRLASTFEDAARQPSRIPLDLDTPVPGAPA